MAPFFVPNGFGIGGKNRVNLVEGLQEGLQRGVTFSKERGYKTRVFVCK